MPLDDAFLRRLRATFQVEAQEHLQAMNRLVVDLERDPDHRQRGDLLEEFFREAHSLKGAARAVGFEDIEAMAHRLETLLAEIKDGRAGLTPEVFALIYEQLDRITAVIKGEGDGSKPGPGAADPQGDPDASAVPPARPAALHTGQAGPRASAAEGGAPAARAARRTADTVRIPTAKLDTLMAQVGELLVARMGMAQPADDLASMAGLVDQWHEDWRQVRSIVRRRGRPAATGGPPAELVRFLQQNEERLRELQERVHKLRHRFSAEIRRMAQVTAGLQDEVKRVRMLPIATVFDLFPRMVRDLAREKGKEVTLRVVGAETELDKTVLELLKDPLVHLMRNSLDHGIEPPHEREALGKPREGTIILEAAAEGGSVVVVVADDGAGIDLQRVGEAALRRGIVQAEALATMDEQEKLALVFRPGLSTSAIITDLSGRGIGLDVVRENIERLHGRIEVYSTPGQGTRFILTLPLTLTTTQALLVGAAGHTFAIPLARVERIVRFPRQQSVAVAGHQAIRFNGRPVCLVGLADVLDLPSDPAAGKGQPADGLVTAVILAAAERRTAFRVDGLLGEQEIVMKNLGPQLPRVRHVAGAAILGTGEVVIILNVADLLKAAQRMQVRGVVGSAVQAEEATRRRTILVADDSITTRTLEKTILEAAGYEVKVATDGAEAWGLLQTNGCDLVVTDVMMPRMDGIELTMRLRNDEALKRLPVILVTSLESREDRERGVAAGADAYIVKSAFDQERLLETIRQLL